MMVQEMIIKQMSTSPPPNKSSDILRKDTATAVAVAVFVSWIHPTSANATSITLVPVGPLCSRSPRPAKNG